MGAPRKAYIIQLVKIQPEDKVSNHLRTEPCTWSGNDHREAKGRGYWAVTQVKGVAMNSTRDDEIFSRIKKIAERLKREYKAEKVILFGCYAKGKGLE